jgi:hypothetical protein
MAKVAITPKSVVACPSAVVIFCIKKRPGSFYPDGLSLLYLTRFSQARPTKKPVTVMAKVAITPKSVVACPIAVVISAMIFYVH